ncbi:MAG: tripartite tricarboxylate transporter TctB family protein [Deltaproteobacteria bacterium]|jgi:putative tricarboxylic transport membrane protein|nr:tripartite tricarboxylate transporter TctB family protein [Deltaproteobacteria bacterium]
MEKLKRFSLETAVECLLAFLGLVIMVVSLAYGFGTLRRPGPGLYPFFIGLFISVFSAALLISDPKPKDRSALFAPQGRKTFLLMIAVFCLWILLMPLLGYVVVTLLATYAFGKIMKLEGWWKPISLSAGTALFLYLLFDYWLYIDLPKGFWG